MEINIDQIKFDQCRNIHRGWISQKWKYQKYHWQISLQTRPKNNIFEIPVSVKLFPRLIFRCVGMNDNALESRISNLFLTQTEGQKGQKKSWSLWGKITKKIPEKITKARKKNLKSRKKIPKFRKNPKNLEKKSKSSEKFKKYLRQKFRTCLPLYSNNFAGTMTFSK